MSYTVHCRSIDLWRTNMSVWSMSTWIQRSIRMSMYSMFKRLFRSRQDLWSQWEYLHVNCSSEFDDWFGWYIHETMSRSQCHLEYDACTKHVDITPSHMGACNNCRNVTCPFHGQCQSEQGNYTCYCPTKTTCSPARVCCSFLFVVCRL
jgi:hypothetical protein